MHHLGVDNNGGLGAAAATITGGPEEDEDANHERTDGHRIRFAEPDRHNRCATGEGVRVGAFVTVVKAATVTVKGVPRGRILQRAARQDTVEGEAVARGRYEGQGATHHIGSSAGSNPG